MLCACILHCGGLGLRRFRHKRTRLCGRGTAGGASAACGGAGVAGKEASTVAGKEAGTVAGKEAVGSYASVA